MGYLEVGIIYPDFTEGIYIYRTLNSGETCYKTEINYANFEGVNSIWCTSPDTCYAVGCKEIYKTTNGGGVDTGTEVSTLKSDIQLTIFPNPTSNLIQLNFSSAEKIYEFKTYNYLGEEINLKYNSINQAHIQHLPSGIYYTELITKYSKTFCRWIKI